VCCDERNGKVIVAIEGLDAAGKSTQVQLLKEYLDMGMGLIADFKFPNYPSVTGRAIKSHLNRGWKASVTESPRVPFGYPLDAMVFQSVQTIDKYAMIDYLKQFEDQPKRCLILDRYTASSIVYGTMDGLPETWLWSIHAGLPKPDLHIYLDISVEESQKRRPSGRDRYESDLVFLDKVRRTYLNLFMAKKLSQQGKENWEVVDAHPPVNKVSATICELVNAYKRKNNWIDDAD